MMCSLLLAMFSILIACLRGIYDLCVCVCVCVTEHVVLSYCSEMDQEALVYIIASPVVRSLSRTWKNFSGLMCCYKANVLMTV